MGECSADHMHLDWLGDIYDLGILKDYCTVQPTSMCVREATGRKRHDARKTNLDVFNDALRCHTGSYQAHTHLWYFSSVERLQVLSLPRRIHRDQPRHFNWIWSMYFETSGCCCKNLYHRRKTMPTKVSPKNLHTLTWAIGWVDYTHAS